MSKEAGDTIVNKGWEVSVIIPVFNSEDTIQDVLTSLEEQTVREYIKEIIVINDGSTDNSLKYISEYAQYSALHIIIINQTNHGVSYSRNVGMKKATAPWIALNDADDCWHKEKLEKQINLLIKHPEIDFLGCNHTDKTLKILNRKINVLYKANIKDICLKMFPQPSTVIFKTEIFKCLGGFDINQRYVEDQNYFLKICFHYNYYYMPEKLVNYDSGKRGYGVRGLSANLPEMYKGNIKNIKELKEQQLITNAFYGFLRLFCWCKYVRRRFITWWTRR